MAYSFSLTTTDPDQVEYVLSTMKMGCLESIEQIEMNDGTVEMRVHYTTQQDQGAMLAQLLKEEKEGLREVILYMNGAPIYLHHYTKTTF
jgi:hypothetical protein